MGQAETYKNWLWESLAAKCVKNLNKHGIDAHFAKDVDEARQKALELTAGYKTFGFGGSDTTRELGLVEELKNRGLEVFDHWQSGLSPEEDQETRMAQINCECFFCSANAVSATGEIVNVDGVGNRTNAMCFGPQKVIIVAGMNKVTQDLDSALQRVRDVAGPMRAKSLGVETPCAETGICNDCNSPMRICRITAIVHRKPVRTDMSVILVNKEMGF